MSRRRSVFEVSTTAQTQLKQQEESLSNEIDQNLRTLALVHPFSDAARPLLVKNAFVKKNHAAFFHVFHYLVNIIIGVIQFRKRFRWPITSSKDESDFRIAALAYFNECHKNFKWPIGPFKMNVVHFPFGVEFMRLIVQLLKTAMTSVLRENDSLHLINSNGISLGVAKAKLKAAEEAYAEAEVFCSKIREMSAELKDRTCHLQSVMRHVLRNTSITEEMIDQGFLSDWEAEQQEVIEKEFEPALRQLENISTKCDSFAQNLMAIKPMQIRFDEEKLNALGLLKMSEHFNPQIDYDKLYRWFIDAMPELVNALYVKPPWSLSRLDRETQLMGHWLSRAHALMTRIDIITLEFPLDMDSKSKQKDVSHGALVNYWYESLMLTPAMKFPVKNDYRIKVWEAIPAMDSPIRKMQPNAVEVLSNSEDTSGFGDGSRLTDITAMRTISTKLNPMSMLNTAMQRNTGFNKTKSIPLRNTIVSSPTRSNNNMPAFNSTMILKEEPLQSPNTKMNTNRNNQSPLRKILFQLSDF